MNLRNKIGQHFSGMDAGVDGGVRLPDLALFIDQITDPLCIARADIITGAIRQPYTPSRVTQEGVGKTEFFGKGGVLLNRIKADPQHFNIL